MSWVIGICAVVSTGALCTIAERLTTIIQRLSDLDHNLDPIGTWYAGSIEEAAQQETRGGRR